MSGLQEGQGGAGYSHGRLGVKVSVRTLSDRSTSPACFKGDVVAKQIRSMNTATANVEGSGAKYGE
ncbi:hypothetical protein FRUB_07450 [Fimbriiglobus ruber]|uniref:Uncharacterized protein n=1 Tax=Fimbriiglobus ruber TaxID=1908690 RepID=A0A225D9P6_9BACT|nr:hypothetical protein FRUB_07450 [Fimbriiglobus ruber]